MAQDPHSSLQRVSHVRAVEVARNTVRPSPTSVQTSMDRSLLKEVVGEVFQDFFSTLPAASAATFAHRATKKRESDVPESWAAKFLSHHGVCCLLSLCAIGALYLDAVQTVFLVQLLVVAVLSGQPRVGSVPPGLHFPQPGVGCIGF